MKTKKVILPLLLMSFICLVVMQSLTPPPPIAPSQPFEQEPPVVKHIWVQKISPAMPGGENILMRIEYEPDARLDTMIDIYLDASTTVRFYDNGARPDAAAKDYNFAGVLEENIPLFISKVLALQSTVASQGGVLHFTGHVGEHITTVRSFDTASFNNGDEVPISLGLIDATECDAQLLKQNSLFITDLSVVEDTARTYNVSNANGNAVGIYTFGNLIKNICNESQTGIQPKEFLKRWLRRWTDTFVINGETVYPRPFVYNVLIAPWIVNAGGSIPVPYNQIQTDLDEWETYWDACDEDVLLTNAPFRLMSIVNRLDLRGNLAYYGSTASAAGETRFIYTLVAPFPMDMTNLNMPSFAAGMPPKASDGANLSSCLDLADWEGMNVIIEYGNPQKSRCDMRAYGQAWADLSEETLGSTDYKDALEDILHAVIDANSDPARTDNNKSALNRIRTNERIFAPSGTCNPASFSIWASNQWELSQFELESGYLVPAPVANTPRNESNSIWDEIFAFPIASQPFVTTPLTPSTYPNYSNANAIPLLEWTYAHQTAVSNGMHNMPMSSSWGGNTMYLAGTAKVDMQSAHYWDLEWQSPSTTHYTQLTPQSSGHDYDKNLRRQISVNTCQGCHAGENKTLFTHVRPLGYGQPNRYWLTNPDVDYKRADTSRFAVNQGWNDVNGTLMRNHRILPGNQNLNRTSAFLTGRSYSGATGTWQDDLIDASPNGDDQRDDDIIDPLSLFYVFNPNSYWQSGTQYTYLQPDGVSGYNDLQLRKQRLCQLLGLQCTFDINESAILVIANVTTYLPYVE